MSTTLPLFWHLSSSSKKDRLDASVKLISSLEHFQAQFEASSPSEEDEGNDEKPDALETLNAQDVSYSVRRLTRGLASPRESSRLGFSVALTELLSRIDTVTCSQIFVLMMDATKSQGSTTGQEERDILFARLFGMTAIIQSGLIVRTKPLPTSQSSATLASSFEGYEQVLTELLVLGEKKSWLRESAWWAISLAADSLKAAEVPWKDEAVHATAHHLFIENKIWSPEKIALALKLQSAFEEFNWRPLFSPTFKNPDLLSNTNLQTLALILKASDADAPKTAAAGGWKTQLHYVWDIMLDRLLNTSNAVKSNFPEFFRIVVDESLFSSTASPERKYWGFQVFQKALHLVAEDNMPMLFTKNFMRTWINHLSKQDRYLHKAAKQTVAEIQTFVQRNPKLGFALILQLTGVHGSQQFDKITKTKTVESIISTMDADDIKQYIAYLLFQANDSEVEVEIINARRRWIIDQLSALIRNGSIAKTGEWVESVLDWFVVNGLNVVKKKSEKSRFIGLQQLPKPQFSDELRQACRDKLLSCLADLTNHMTTIESDNTKVKIAGLAADGELWVTKVLSTIEELKQDTKHVSYIAEIDEEEEVLRAKVREVVAQLKKVSGNQQEAASGMQLLLVASLVQQSCSEEVVSLETIELCTDAAAREFSLDKVKRKTQKGRPSASAPADEEDSDDDGPEPIDAIVDTIIGFMEKSTVYMRTIGNQVFSLISGQVKSSTIDLILTQLETRDPAAEDEEMDQDEDDEDEDKPANGEDVEDDSQSSDDDEGDDENEDSDNEEVDEELRQRILEALSVNGIKAANEDDEDSEEEEYMDDDQMMAIDEHLAEVFRSRVNEKKASKDLDAQREATHFKNRVLDLIDIFIKKQPSSPLIVRLIIPLVDLITRSTADEKQLSDKARGIARSRIGKAKEFAPAEEKKVEEGGGKEEGEGEEQEVTSIFETLHKRARTERSPDHLSILSDCCIYISQVMLHAGMQDQVVVQYRHSLIDFISRKNSSLNVSFFQQFFRRSRTAAWDLRNDLLEISGKAANLYRQFQAYQLIHDLLTEPPFDIHDEVTQYLQALCKTLLDVISSACDGSDNSLGLNASQMREVLKLALVGARQARKVVALAAEDAAVQIPQPQNVVATIWDSVAWTRATDLLLASERFKGAAQMCKQVVQIASAPSNTSQSQLKGKVEKKVKPKGRKESKERRVKEEEKQGGKEEVEDVRRENKRTSRKRKTQVAGADGIEGEECVPPLEGQGNKVKRKKVE
ncbi:DNA polymerase phi-domain-containing protein [Lentinula aff. lateritia]|uniref:DNA polymerase phi-domain-containing protein n=1 Tax=Lentinula aff. lateritia TaxID=2804960 RepID=A0ACC1U6A9_9AGAR|nr:DNA polymerase phi-domain-containing protein [Lentinula aff. lateritia]